MTIVSALLRGVHLEAGMRVGLYGGSFDPAHEGHAHVAAVAQRRLGLSSIIWLVSPGNPLKADAHLSINRRIASARRMAGRGMVVTDIEARLGTRYTIAAVRAFRRRFPSVRFVWVMGADGLAQLHRWRAWADLMAEVPIAVVARPGYALRALGGPAARRFRGARLHQDCARSLPLRQPPAWVYLTAPLNPKSSTRLRAQDSPDRQTRARVTPTSGGAESES